MNEHIKNVLRTLGVDVDNDTRWDDNATAAFADQLRQIEATLYRTLYPELKAFSFVPTDTNVNPGAEQYGYYMIDHVGVAKLIANYAEDLEDVAVKTKREFVEIRGIGQKYSWSIQDVRAAAMANIALTSEKAEIARMSVATKIDNMAAFGDTESGLYGILNHPNVSLVTPITGSWVYGTTTGIQMVQDVTKFINAVNNKSKRILKVNTHVSSPTRMQMLSQTFVNTANASNVTALDLLKASFPGVSFEEWDELENADVAGTGPRQLAYHRAPMVITMPLPIAFEALPPQAKGLRFEVPCHARAGGVVVRYTMALGYMDGC